MTYTSLSQYYNACCMSDELTRLESDCIAELYDNDHEPDECEIECALEHNPRLDVAFNAAQFCVNLVENSRTLGINAMCGVYGDNPLEHPVYGLYAFIMRDVTELDEDLTDVLRNMFAHMVRIDDEAFESLRKFITRDYAQFSCMPFMSTLCIGHEDDFTEDSDVIEIARILLDWLRK